MRDLQLLIAAEIYCEAYQAHNLSFDDLRRDMVIEVIQDVHVTTASRLEAMSSAMAIADTIIKPVWDRLHTARHGLRLVHSAPSALDFVKRQR